MILLPPFTQVYHTADAVRNPGREEPVLIWPGCAGIIKANMKADAANFQEDRHMIGIIGAMEEEVNQLKEAMKDVSAETRASMEFCRGKLEGADGVVVRSGIGKVNAGICAQILADVYHVDQIINTGIAGSLQAEINIGDIVLSTDALQHDMDARAFGYPEGQIPRMETLSFQADEGLIACANF